MSETMINPLDEIYKEHFKKFSQQSCSVKEYCRQNDLKPSRFGYYRKKLLNYPEKKFVNVKVLPPERAESKKPSISKNIDIDPKWLSEFIFNLLRFR